MRSWKVPGTVVHVHDGDTMTLDLDLGWYITYRQSIRVMHINAPEVIGASKVAGLKSRDRVRELLPPGTVVEIDSVGLDKYGRSLAVVTLPQGGDLGSLLLSEGLAIPYEGHNG